MLIKKKYNIALTPINKKHAFIDFAKPFTPIADQYCLGPRSDPHVTLCQFYAEDLIIINLWESVLKYISRETLSLSFYDYDFSTWNNRTYYITLMPHDHAALIKLHREVTDILKEPYNNKFDPHLTLFNTLRDDCKQDADRLIQQHLPISDIFRLSLGYCDNVGQFELIKSYQN